MKFDSTLESPRCGLVNALHISTLWPIGIIRPLQWQYFCSRICAVLESRLQPGVSKRFSAQYHLQAIAVVPVVSQNTATLLPFCQQGGCQTLRFVSLSTQLALLRVLIFLQTRGAPHLSLDQVQRDLAAADRAFSSICTCLTGQGRFMSASVICVHCCCCCDTLIKGLRRAMKIRGGKQLELPQFSPEVTLTFGWLSLRVGSFCLSHRLCLGCMLGSFLEGCGGFTVFACSEASAKRQLASLCACVSDGQCLDFVRAWDRVHRLF